MSSANTLEMALMNYGTCDAVSPVFIRNISPVIAMKISAKRCEILPKIGRNRILSGMQNSIRNTVKSTLRKSSHKIDLVMRSEVGSSNVCRAKSAAQQKESTPIMYRTSRKIGITCDGFASDATSLNMHHQSIYPIQANRAFSRSLQLTQ